MTTDLVSMGQQRLGSLQEWVRIDMGLKDNAGLCKEC